MRFAALFTLLTFFSLGMISNPAYAADSSDQNGAADYCNEQAEMAGIEDADEKQQYIQDCTDSFNAPGNSTE